MRFYLITKGKQVYFFRNCEGKGPIPTLASISTSLSSKELGRAEWPLSVKVSVKCGAEQQPAHNSSKLH